MSLIFDLDKTPMSRELCGLLYMHEVDGEVKHFKDGEISVNINSSVRGQDVFIISSISTPVNEKLMAVLIVADALKRASCGWINLICPYLGYSRQDRKTEPRQPITARLVADLLQTAGINRIITVDLHATQIVGFYNIPVDNVSMVPVAAYHLRECINNPDMCVVVSPDHGGVTRAKTFADILGCEMAVIDKQRKKANEVANMQVIGNVRGKECIIVDDMIDTGGTLMKAAAELKKQGATQVIVYATHGLFSDDARKKIDEDQNIDMYVVSDTLPQTQNILHIAPFLQKVITSIDNKLSVSEAIKNFLYLLETQMNK